MRYTGRIIAVTLILMAHTSFVVYFSILEGQIHIVSLLGYFLWFFIGYWTGKQYDKAKYFSEKDPLTNLYNRRFVMNTFEKVTSLAVRTNKKLFVLVFDCDNFKDINDNYGHQKGDLVLSMIGEIIVGTMRKSDVVARWGGDEFLVLGHYEEEIGLQTVLERLEDNFRNLSKEIDISVIVSIGSAIFPYHGIDLFELIKIADENMYTSKLTKKGFISLDLTNTNKPK
jgi:diguanylate cyclase (GGDEF)-like protein